MHLFQRPMCWKYATWFFVMAGGLKHLLRNACSSML